MKMTSARRIVLAVLLLAPLAWAGALAAAQVVGTAAAGARAATVTGWVVDANSWLGQGIRGPQHQARSAASAEAGTPLVILLLLIVVQIAADGRWDVAAAYMTYRLKQADRRLAWAGADVMTRE